MNHREIELNLRKVGSAFILGRGASLEKIRETEAKLGINFPSEIVHFYETLNGLSVNSPKFELLSVEELQQKNELIIFGHFNGCIPVGFESSSINSAGQWNIVNSTNGYVITLTISSFLTNKIWAWLLRGREVWEKELYT